VGLSQFAGRFVWVDYAAPWCGPCLRQAPAIKRLEHAYGDKVVFLTVLTSDDKPGAPSNRYTARRWANQYNLDPTRVVAGSEWQRVIPQHGVFSPLGQTLYWEVGLHSEGQIRSVLAQTMGDWDVWYADNKNSISVLLGEIGE
jgi:thiol-disulfide isomerase/thioredoxin